MQKECDLFLCTFQFLTPPYPAQGYALDTPAVPPCDSSNTTAFCRARALWDGEGGEAGLSAAYVAGADMSTAADWNGSEWRGTGWPIAPGVKLLDPAVEPFRGYELALLAAQLVMTPAAGFCLDRMDHAAAFNPFRDDLLAWANGSAAAWLGSSFLAVSRDLVAIAHAAGALGAVSVQLPRIDLAGHFDAFLNEDADETSNAALNGLLAIAKPASAWRYSSWANESYELFLQQAWLLA